jgi:hypothetical protein
MNTTPMTIGTLTTTEPRDVTELYECAAWSKVVTVPPGTYEIVAYARYGDGRPNVGHSLYVKMTGEITGGSMRSRIGAHYSKRDDMVERYGQNSDVSDSLSTTFEVRAGVVPHSVEVLLTDIQGARTITREVVEIADLVLPEGVTLDASKIEVAFTFESGGRLLAAIKPRRDAYRAAWRACRAA